MAHFEKKYISWLESLVCSGGGVLNTTHCAIVEFGAVQVWYRLSVSLQCLYTQDIE